MFYESEPFWRQATSARPTVLSTKRNLLAWFTEIFLAWHLLQVKLDPGAQMISAESVYLWALLPSMLALFSDCPHMVGRWLSAPDFIYLVWHFPAERRCLLAN